MLNSHRCPHTVKCFGLTLSADRKNGAVATVTQGSDKKQASFKLVIFFTKYFPSRSFQEKFWGIYTCASVVTIAVSLPAWEVTGQPPCVRACLPEKSCVFLKRSVFLFPLHPSLFFAFRSPAAPSSSHAPPLLGIDCRITDLCGRGFESRGQPTPFRGLFCRLAYFGWGSEVVFRNILINYCKSFSSLCHMQAVFLQDIFLFCNFHWHFIFSSTCLCHSAAMESHCYTIHQRTFFFLNRLDTECWALLLYFQDGHVQPFSPSFCLFLSAFNTGTSVKIYQRYTVIVFSSAFHLFSFSLLAFGFLGKTFFLPV